MRAPIGTVEKARALRRALTCPEVLLRQLLRGRGLSGLRFRRQYPVGPYVLDFYCSALALGVEVDGGAHDHPDRAVRDERRDLWLAGQGIAVFRVPARDLLTEDGLQSVLATIAARRDAPSTTLRVVPLPRKRVRNSAVNLASACAAP